MGLYAGNSSRLRIRFNGVSYTLRVLKELPKINSYRLLSSDNLMLKDRDGLYLVVNNIENDESNNISQVTTEDGAITTQNSLTI